METDGVVTRPRAPATGAAGRGGTMSSPDPRATPVAARPRILLVEDNDAASRGLSKILEFYGFEVAAAGDGDAAVRALTQGPPPDFLLTDLRLPDLDGRDIARLARQLDPPPRVAVITGWDLEPHLLDDPSCGIDWVFTKPLDVQALVSALGAALGDHRSPRPLP
jgi:two-component system, OmpR family, response regulator MprA